MCPEKKISLLHEFLVLLLVIVMVKYSAQLWPVSLALVLALLVHGVRKLFRWFRERRQVRYAFVPEEQRSTEADVEPVSAPVIEQDIVTMAHGGSGSGLAHGNVLPQARH